MSKDLNLEVKENFLDYSHEVNAARAFPNVIDGLKPGQRAILWEMFFKGFTSNKPHVKCAKIVGSVIAELHSHGDAAVYEALTRMSQEWINNLPEVDWHGANGSIQISAEGAHQRYCVTGETLIKTNKGTLPIRELTNWADKEDNLKDIYIYDYLNNLVPATKIFNCGKHPVTKLTLKNGQSITVTDNHPIVVLNPDECNLLWKETKNLTLKDKVAIPIFNYTIDQNDTDYTSGDLEFKMLGCMISEGYITAQNRIGINNTDISLIQPVYDYFYSQIPELKAKINYNEKRKCYEFCIANINYYDKFVTKYEYANNAKDKKLPEIILKASLENKACFLRYLFEGDGGLSNIDTSSPSIIYSSYSEVLIKQLQIILLQDFNIFSSFSSSQRNTGIEYKLRITGRGLALWKQKIGFVSKRKNEALSKAVKNFNFNTVIANTSYYSTTEFSHYVRKKVKNPYCKGHAFSNYKNFYKCKNYLDSFNYDRLETLLNNYLFVPIKSIEVQKDEQEVFSVRVDNLESDHSYIANGFINHNTESRLSKSTEDGMFSNIKKNVVPLKWNFSEDIEWGEYLPAIYPRLLVNGSQGIGSTIANHWTLFNLGEACAVIEKYLTTGELDYSTFYPDYPSGGIIINQKDLSKIHATGKGKVILRGTTEIKDDIIYITELPYQTYVEPLIEDIKKLVIAEEIPDIINILNKSDKKHLLIEIECERGKAQKVLNQLFAKTDLQKSFSPNQWGIVKKVPQLLTLKEYLDCFIEYNLGYIKKENEFDYNKAKERQEIVEGLLKALESIDNIITLIKKSNSSKDAIKDLMKTYEFTEKQATAIVNMKLGKLAQLEKVELNKEAEELASTITDCLSIINDREKQKALYLEKLKSFCKKYATPRKTKVIQLAGGNDPTPAEPCFIVARESGNVSYDAEMDIKTQRRNGKGVKVENDKIIYAAKGNTKQIIYGFTANGKVFNKPQPADNRFVSFVPDSDDKYLYFLTKQGMIKKALFEDYRKLSKNGSIAIKLKENDEVVRVISTNKENIAIFTHDGYLLKTDNIPTSSRTAMGVKGIKLGEGDYSIAISAANEVLIGIEDGKGKTLNIEKTCCQNRGGKGIKYSSSTVGSVVDICGEKAIVYGSERQICIDIQNLSAKTALIKDSDIKMITMLGE